MADELKLISHKRVVGTNYFIEFQANEFSTRVLNIAQATREISENRKSVIPSVPSGAKSIDVVRASQRAQRISTQKIDISERSLVVYIPLDQDANLGDKTFTRGGRQQTFRNASILFPEGVNLIVISHIIATACNNLNNVIKLTKGKRLFRVAKRNFHPIFESSPAVLDAIVNESYEAAERRSREAGESTTRAIGEQPI